MISPLQSMNQGAAATAGRMRAVVLYGKEDLRLEEVAIPTAGAGELVLRVGAALTCGTDLKVYRRGYHALMLTPPIPFGHELAGTVVEVGAGVAGFKLGDRVVMVQEYASGGVPLAMKGVVVGLNSTSVDVVWDVPFMGGETLGGRLVGAVIVTPLTTADARSIMDRPYHLQRA